MMLIVVPVSVSVVATSRMNGVKSPCNLEALIDRKSYYRLVEIGAVETVEQEAMFGLWSSGEFFPIIPAAELGL